jgi:hypothetical protein
MKNHRNLGFIIPLLHYAALAVAQNHVPEQAVNLGDTSFLDGVAGPGIVVEEIADGTHGNEIVDATGHKVPGAGQLNSISVRDREPVTRKDNNILVSHPHFPPVGWACRQGPSAAFHTWRCLWLHRSPAGAAPSLPHPLDLRTNRPDPTGGRRTAVLVRSAPGYAQPIDRHDAFPQRPDLVERSYVCGSTSSLAKAV